MISAGIDAGSRAIKIVLWDSLSQCVMASAVTDQGVRQSELAEALFNELLDSNDLDRGEVRPIVATGYARNGVMIADTTITEITCHARGVHHVMPEARTVIEIGGQDSKLLRLDAGGQVRDFAMNDRCAAGTGRFLEMVAQRLGVGLERLGELARAGARPAAISSICAVFAETEIIGLLAGGGKAEDIAAGVQAAVASRVLSMAGREVATPIAFTGGVAMIPGMREALSAALGRPVDVAPQPQFTGALGAAILAAKLPSK